MQHSLFEIKDKLLQALDRDNNVVDMELAMEVISLLEKTAITKEALEATRLGRYINEMRKKTTNQDLARRAKGLVRRWRDTFAKPTENGASSNVPAVGLAAKTQISRTIGLTTSSSSPSLKELSRLSSPAFNSWPVTSPVLRSASSLQSTSPAFRDSTLSPMTRRVVSSPSNSVASNSSISPGINVTFPHTQQPNSSRPSTPASVAKSKVLSPGPGRPESIKNHSHGVKRLREDDDSSQGFKFSEKHSGPTNGIDGTWHDECSRESVISWSSDSRSASVAAASSLATAIEDSRASFSSRSKGRSKRELKLEGADLLKEKFATKARIPKVKTTQELLEDLARRSGSPTLASKAGVLGSASFTPSAALKVTDSAALLRDAKGDLMNKFLQSQAPVALAEPAVPEKKSSTETEAPKEDSVEEILARLPPLDPSKIDWSDDVGEPEEQESEEAAEPAEPFSHKRPITEEEMERLHSGPVENVNGSRDFENEFHEWHETLSLSSYKGELLHVLPYVVIE